ncbi:hypothetical protein OF83DRAFT_1174398 [Amylostereum chailletii]|nr:hypothetical protein OF83DRAFT_1174398 [Amylostereum chailletii]
MFDNPPPKLFIALYGRYSRMIMEWHWALVLTEYGYPSFTESTSAIYQITDKGSKSTGIERWRTDHRTLALGASTNFLGVVELPELEDTTFEDVKDVLDTMPVFPRGLSQERETQWNCGFWVLDILIQYGQNIWGMDLTHSGSTYEKLGSAILARAGHLESSGKDGSDAFVTEDGLKVVKFRV